MQVVSRYPVTTGSLRCPQGFKPVGHALTLCHTSNNFLWALGGVGLALPSLDFIDLSLLFLSIIFHYLYHFIFCPMKNKKYDNTSIEIGKILKDNWQAIENDEVLKQIWTKQPFVALKRHKNFKDILVRSKFNQQ